MEKEKLYVVTTGKVNAGKFTAFKYDTLDEVLRAWPDGLPHTVEIQYGKNRIVQLITRLNDGVELDRVWTRQVTDANVKVGQQLPAWLEL